MGKKTPASLDELHDDLKGLPQPMLFQFAVSYGAPGEHQSAKRLYTDLDADTLASIIVARHSAQMKEKKKQKVVAPARAVEDAAPESDGKDE